MSLVQPYIAHIDSDFRQNGTHSHFNYTITLPNNRVFDRVAVLSASIPKSFYLVDGSSAERSFTITEDGSSAVISLTAGNYSIRSLAKQLTNLLNAGSPNGYTYSVTYPAVDDVQTGKVTFRVSDNTGVQPILSFGSSSKVWRTMGFESNSSNVFSSNELVSVNVPLLSIGEIFVKSSVVKAETNSISDSILCSINIINAPDFSAIAYQPSTDLLFTSKPFSGHTGDSYSFVVVDNNGNILNFNGVSCNIDLVFFKFDDVNQMQKQHMLMSWFNDVANSS